MREIPLTPSSLDMVAFVDDEDYERLSQHKWQAFHSGGALYAARNQIVNGAQIRVYMHREIMGQGPRIQHRNSDGLDNRRENLRFTPSRFVGVSWCPSDQKWRARLGTKTLGRFTKQHEAAKAYKRAKRAVA